MQTTAVPWIPRVAGTISAMRMMFSPKHSIGKLTTRFMGGLEQALVLPAIGGLIFVACLGVDDDHKEPHSESVDRRILALHGPTFCRREVSRHFLFRRLLSI